MSRRNASLFLVFLLLASLAIKLPGSISGKEVVADNVPGDITEFLQNNGFTTEPHVSDVDLFSIAAHSSDCRISVAILSPQGWHSNVIKELAPEGYKVFFLYGGEVYSDQPVMLTRFEDYWTRFLRYAGSDSRQSPVLGIAQSPQCQKREIAWADLSSKF